MSNGNQFGWIVLTPGGSPDPSLAIAGSRAGALGLLNLEFATDLVGAASALETLAAKSSGRFGVLLSSDAQELLDLVLARTDVRFEVVALSGAEPVAIARAVAAVHQSGRLAYVVVRTLEEARAGQEAGADALIAKGHEAGGWVAEETAFVLLQRLIPKLEIPVWIHGGVGIHTASACAVAGAAGAVLDSQLLLTRESPLPESVRARIASMDGSETICFGSSVGASFRAYSRPDLPVVDELRRLETALLVSDRNGETAGVWRTSVSERVGWEQPETQVLAVGQDASFASVLARKFGTVGGVLAGLRQAIADHCRSAARLNPLAEGGPLAISHGTRYPIVQGPMTRVSDRAEFADAVAGAGALPFLALALMRGPEIEELLAATRDLLGEKPWGVGVLGFVPPELRTEQMDVVRAYKPPFALIAGGRPDQARALEAEGVPTYLHVPSPGLLQMFLRDGARRFVFEGRECGGHVGPRTSFVLWESMVETMLESLPANVPASEYHILFAGGVHDGLSAAMTAALAAPLAERGVRVGVLIGTAYLFTEEAVEGGAILPGFQQAAFDCEQTSLLESGPGHATRCAPSPFVAAFEDEKRRLVQSGLPPEELRHKLEMLNIGRLRIASKGVDRNPHHGQSPDAPKLVDLGPAEQWERGMYMIGQVAALRDGPCTLAELHEQVSGGCTRILKTLVPVAAFAEPASPPPAAIAIVGMGTILPGAPDLKTFWANLLNKVDAITEVPADRWDWRRYYDADRSARDKVYSRWGGFLTDVPFDPVVFGMPPSTLPSIEPFQLLALAVVREALRDAGFLDRPFPKERTSVILGAGGGGADLTAGYMVRSSLPSLFGDSAGPLADRLDGALPEWTEDSFAGILMNVAAGRVANRFDLGGVNYTVDAACASSLAAVYLAVRDLEARTSDVAIVGGVDAIQNPFSFLCFSKTQALSPTGRCRTFDAQADGIAISEGFAAVVLKRLDDAERDGDRIYAVIRGIGGASDGRDRGLTAPRPEGQVRALRRAYDQAGFSSATVGLIEAHGTGTVAGDTAEVQALTTYFGETSGPRQRCALGSVKSMIGHTKATAGVAGLVKVALALHHRVLPPTLGVKQPNPKANFGESPFYVNSETRPWIQGEDATPRRAGVSAFGFGGTNFHVIAEEYTGAFLPKTEAVLDPWPAELFVWRGRTRKEILESVTSLLNKLVGGAKPKLADLAATVSAPRKADADSPTLALVATSIEDLTDKLRNVQALLKDGTERIHQPQGIHYAEKAFSREGRVAFLFPGQGSQYLNMGREVVLAFPEARACLDAADDVLAEQFAQPLSRYIFPPPSFSDAEEEQRQTALKETSLAQAALGATELAYLHLLRSLGVEPEMAAGHSYGEFAALCAAGCFSEDVLLRLSEARGRFIREGMNGESGTMAAVDAGRDDLQALLADPEITLANFNAPRQTVISGPRAAVERALAWCAGKGIQAQPIPVDCAFHSTLVAPAQQRLAAMLDEVAMEAPRFPVFSNMTAAPYPADPSAVAGILGEHLVSPVEFVREVEAMYEAGARIFVEVGPRSVLSGLVGRILGDRPHVCAPLDQSGRPGLAVFLNGLAALATEGVPVRAERLFESRSVRRLNLAKLEEETGLPRYTPTTWLVNGGRARPAQSPAGRPGPLEIQLPNSAAAPSTRLAIEPSDANTLPLSSRPAATNGHVVKDGHAAEIHPGSDRGFTRHASEAPAVSEHNRLVPRASGSEGNGVHDSKSSHIPAHRSVSPTMPDAPLAAPASEVTGMIQQFQHVMQRFLQTQQTVMHDLVNAYQGAAEPHSNGNGTYTPFTPSIAPIAHYAPPTNGDAHHPIAPAPPTPPPAPEVVREEARVVVPEPPAQEIEVPGLSLSQINERLLAVVSERTGYPPEMLELDADLEADLGIDSIKRVEIAGTIVRELVRPDGPQPDIERLTSSRTLRQVLDLLAALVSSDAPATQAAPAPTPVGDHSPAGPEIRRYLPRLVNVPDATPTAGLAPDGTVVIVDDMTGVGERIAARLQQQGHPVVRVNPHATTFSPDEDCWNLDLSRPEEVNRLVDQLRQRSATVASLIHLAALRPVGADVGFDHGRWNELVTRNLAGLLLLTQALRADLEKSATMGGAAVLGASSLGGSFGFDLDGPAFFPGHGGLAGFLKTLAQEWPSVRSKAVDVTSGEPARVAEELLAELFASDNVVEVGYRAGNRQTLELVPCPLSADPGLAQSPLTSDSVILITGGARGITSEAALAIARLCQPTLLLVGRTPPPDGPESPETVSLTEPHSLKRAIIEEQRRLGLSPTPTKVEELYRERMHQREMRANLEQLRQTGARVEYLTCDARDATTFGALIQEVYRIHGRIDGVIHGAGVIEDKLIRDKRLDSFTRVLSTKVDSALTLAGALRPEGLKFLVFFSSVSGRFGNRGQADYASANEVLNKLAQSLDRRWPARVVAINWGPWLTTGMVSPEVQRQFAERGIALIPVAEGCRRLIEELQLGRKGDVEVLIGGIASSPEVPPASTPRPSVALPLLASAGLHPVRSADSSSLEVVRSFDPAHDLFLDDHRLDGRPVLPFAAALELMAEVAATGWPDLDVVGLRNVRMLRGVIVDPKAYPLRVTAKEKSATTIEMTVVSAENPRVVHYQAVVEMGSKRAPSAFQADPASLEGASPLLPAMAEIYRAYLFHGPLFQGIESIEAMGPRGARAILRPSSPREMLAGAPSGDWLIDPVVVDCALQMQLIWAREHWDMTLLPSRAGEYHRYGALRSEGNADDVIHYELRIREGSQPPLCHADHYFYQPDGRLLGVILDMEGTGSKAMNRLAVAQRS